MLGPRVTWWKEVKAITGDRATIARVTRSGRYRGPLAFTVPVADVAYFVFSKGRFLGRRTEMYAVGNPAEKDGRQLDVLLGDRLALRASIPGVDAAPGRATRDRPQPPQAQPPPG